MAWQIKEKTYSVEVFLRTGSYQHTQAAFKRNFNTYKPPSRSVVYTWVKNFQERGSVEMFRKKRSDRPSHSGRPLTARSAENIVRVQESVDRSPKKSVRRRSQDLGIARESLRAILSDDLKLHPYRIQVKQKLTEAHMQKRVEMCEWITDMIEDVPDFLDDIWFSDESHFNLSGHVNWKNNVYWGSQPPDMVLQRPLHSVRCTAWVAMSTHGIIGPFWFEDDSGNALSVNTQRYIEVLEKFWRSLGTQRGLRRETQWFQQDGAPPHTAGESIDWLSARFGDRVISRKLELEWAPHSPDLSPLDFYLWGHLKDRVFLGQPKTIDDLKAAVTNEIYNISREECVRVISHFQRRVQLCLQRGGRHLEHVL